MLEAGVSDHRCERITTSYLEGGSQAAQVVRAGRLAR
jgi:hypothetical protein